LPEVGYGPENGRREHDEQRGDGGSRVDEPGPERKFPLPTRSSTQSGKKKESTVTEKMVFEKS
jgi:hypothetical protein